MKILDRYVVRIFLSSFGLVLFFALGIFIVINMFSIIEPVFDARRALAATGHTVIGVITSYYLVSTPFFFMRLAPFITLVGATIALIRLLKANEITPMVAAGRSPARIMAPIFACAVLLVVSMLAAQQWGVPRLSKARQRLEQITDGNVAGKVTDLHPIQDGHHNIWSIGVYYPRQRKMESTRAVWLSNPKTGATEGTLEVPAASWSQRGPKGPGWYASGAVLIPSRAANPKPWPATAPLPTDLTPGKLEFQVSMEEGIGARSMSISQAAHLVDVYPGLPKLAVAAHSLVTWPLGTLLLLLVGLPLVLRFRERSLFVGVGISLAVSAAYFALDTVCLSLGNRAALPAVVAAWLPVLLFSSLAVALVE